MKSVAIAGIGAFTVLFALFMILNTLNPSDISEIDLSTTSLKVTTHPKADIFLPEGSSLHFKNETNSIMSFVFDDYVKYTLQTDGHIKSSQYGFEMTFPKNRIWTVYDGGCPYCELPTDLNLPNLAIPYVLESDFEFNEEINRSILERMGIIILVSSKNELSLEENARKIIKHWTENNVVIRKLLDSDLEIYILESELCFNDPKSCDSVMHVGFLKNDKNFVSVIVFSEISDSISERRINVQHEVLSLLSSISQSYSKTIQGR